MREVRSFDNKSKQTLKSLSLRASSRRYRDRWVEPNDDKDVGMRSCRPSAYLINTGDGAVHATQTMQWAPGGDQKFEFSGSGVVDISKEEGFLH